MNYIITIITCSLILIINFIACVIDAKRIEKIEKHVKALEEKQHD